MARPVEEVLAQMLAWLPEEFHPLAPLLAGVAASNKLALESLEAMGQAAGIESATGSQLELEGRGTRTHRGLGESDADYRPRLRKPQNAGTRAAILDAVNAILADHTARQADLYEWFDGPYLDHDYLSDKPVGHEGNGLAVVIPELATPGWGESYLDVSAYLDADTYLGIDEDPAVYTTIARAIGLLKAAGIQAALVMRGNP